MSVKTVHLSGDFTSVALNRILNGDLVVTILTAGDNSWKPTTAVVRLSDNDRKTLCDMLYRSLPPAREGK